MQLDAARAAAAGADVIIACGGAATTEAADRDSLRLDNHDFLTALVAGVDHHEIYELREVRARRVRAREVPPPRRIEQPVVQTRSNCSLLPYMYESSRLCEHAILCNFYNVQSIVLSMGL